MDAALLLIDVVNPMDFDGAEALLPHAMQAATAIASLKYRARVAGVPVVYVNDNFGRWDLGFRELVQSFRDENVPGVPLLDRLSPDERDHFILKPLHSAFYCTSLDAFLTFWRIRRLVLTGIAGNVGVFFSANDAHMRGYEIAVPSDCVASETVEDNGYALRQMTRILGADTRASPQVALCGSVSSRRGAATVRRSDREAPAPGVPRP